MMNKRWALIPTTLLLVGIVTLTATVAQAQTVRTPIQSGYTSRGNSGGPQSGQCGFTAAQPNLRLEVTEPLASLRFRVEGGGAPTLMITNGRGRSECVMSDNLSGGTIELPGVWEQGVYDVYVGDRSGNSHSYTLSISQE
ncbi:MAG: hypothetical protein VKK04_01220 [Synechococcales bacterium]|nr:hypothetical protein [Synechococcales bacterium]